MRATRLEIEIVMENAAFEPSSGCEAARLLRELARKIASEDLLATDGGVEMDANGNKVLKWRCA